MKEIKDFVKGGVYNDTDTIRISKLDFITMVYIALYDARLKVNKNATFNDIIKAYNNADNYVICYYNYLIQDKYMANNIVYIDAALNLKDIIKIVKSYDIRNDYTISLDSVDIVRLRNLIDTINKSKKLDDYDDIKSMADTINTILTINCADIM